MIGKKVWKNSKTNSGSTPKPFKSGLRVNTVTAIIVHPLTGKDAFTFEEDDSFVECRLCSIAPNHAFSTN